jgi:hydrogenase maturation protease
MPAKDRKICVIGVGNRYRSDDGVGLAVIDLLDLELKKQAIDDVALYKRSGEGAELIEIWKNFDFVILIDAVAADEEAGSIYQFRAHQEQIPAAFFHYSTHAFSIAEAVELARVLNQLPAQLIIYGIVGNNYRAGEALGAQVEKAAGEVVARVIDEIERI